MEHRGGLEVVTGNMFGGKTREFLRRISIEEAFEKKVQLFKHPFDNRYSPGCVCSHDGVQKPAIVVASAVEIQQRLDPGARIIGISEVQFYDGAIVNLCYDLANTGKTVIAEGLFRDFRGELFSFAGDKDKPIKRNISDLIVIADLTVYLYPKCKHELEEGVFCEKEAPFIQRVFNGTKNPVPYDFDVVHPGAREYIPYCRQHYKFYPENRHLRL